MKPAVIGCLVASVAIGTLCACGHPGPIQYLDRVKYVRETPAAYDVGAVISEDDFRNDALLATFQDFYRRYSPTHKIVRLTLARDPLSLGVVTSAPYSGFSNPAGFRGWRSFDVAQLVGRDDQAIVHIRRETGTIHEQLSGHRDPGLFFAD